MQAVEFNTQTSDGVIKIPKLYKSWYEKKFVRVILLNTEEESKLAKESREKKIQNFFNKIHFDISSYKFNRDEANER